ncbi:MAG: adenylyltransferase/cytidyltransferase family protein [Rickettsiales bacterium]|jgi:glycerol-3-phosphate cytidylyltransferase|nr:adenylyltransferase/cytidyltransferase family protein [Rickettsiales bacterium]
MVIGYTTGVFDMFHIGHLNLLRRARENCDYLIVGVTIDELSVSRKGKVPIIPFIERCEIIGALKFVNKVVSQDTMDKMAAWNRYKFDIMFVGDDWKGSPEWDELEKKLAEVGARIMYFPYTKSTSSTKMREYLNQALTDRTSSHFQ